MEIRDCFRNGFTVLGIIGINRSPSCGVNTTSKNNQEVDGKGVFIDMLSKALEKKNISIDMIGYKATGADKALKSIQGLIDKY